MKNILAVCIGNICRSPVAEAMLKARLPDCKVWSAGLHAMVGRKADATARQIAEEFKLDLSIHVAQQLSGWMCSHADLILVMEASHKKQLEKLYPTARGKIHCLGEFGPQGPFDIADPYRQSRAAFEAAHAAIALGVDEWVHRINLVS